MATQAWNERINRQEAFEPEIRTLNVLLIDDDEDYYFIIRDLLNGLEHVKFNLRWTQERNEALELLQTTAFDAVLVDYQLGIYNGVDLTREITAGGVKVPVILLTGHGSYKLDLEAMRAGAIDYLVKGDLNAPLLERTLRYAIERKGVEMELERRVQERTQELAAAVEGLRAEIAERVRAQKKIAYQANLLSNVSDAIVATDDELVLTSWNHAAENIYGWTASEVLGKPVSEVLRTEYIGLTRNDATRQLLETGEFNAVVIQYHKDGGPVYIEGKTIALRDEAGRINGFVSVYRNITKRSEDEAATRQMVVELNAVQRRLIENVEAERLFLSQELHDGPLQVLNGMVFKIASALSNNPTDELREQLLDMRQQAIELIDSLRAICNNLRPPALAPFGLEKAIRSHADKFQTANPDILLALHLDSDGQTLPERVRLALFRIYQQALANIVKHADAGLVEVDFVFDDHQAILRIRDDGVGFEVPKHLMSLAKEGHLGLVGASERAEAVGGQLSVQSTAGEGTQIQVVVPF